MTQDETSVVQTQPPAAPAPAFAFNAEAIIAQAVQNNVPIETMERLLAMRRELKAEWEKQQYNEDMAKLQQEMPVITKSEGVKDKNGKHRYSYAPIDKIVAETKDVIGKHGFSYTIDVIQDAQSVTTVVTTTHKHGHEKQSRFQIPIDASAYMSAPQKVAAAMTYAKRYAFCNAFGIMTSDQDTDAQEDTTSAPATGKAKTKPSPKKTTPPANSEQQLKVAIAQRAKALGVDFKAKTAVDWIERATGLKLEPKNFAEIASRLQVLIDERQEAGGQKKNLTNAQSAPSGGGSPRQATGKENQDGNTPEEAQISDEPATPWIAAGTPPTPAPVEEDDMTPEERAHMESVLGRPNEKPEPTVVPEAQEPAHVEPTVQLDTAPDEQKPAKVKPEATKPRQEPIKLAGEDLTKIKPSTVALNALRGIMAQRLAISANDIDEMVKIINERFGFDIKKLEDLNKEQEITLTMEFLKTKPKAA